MTTMLLARHGQSEWNAAGRWQGQADPTLTDLGRRQARSACERLGSVDVIVSSPLQRALETARIISNGLGVGPVVVDVDLVERDAGEWSGLTRAEIEATWPGYLGERRRPPGFETDESVLRRAHAALARIEEEYRGADVLILTHGGLVYALERDHDLPVERLPNLAGRWLTHHGERVTLGERVLLADPDELTVPSQL